MKNIVYSVKVSFAFLKKKNLKKKFKEKKTNDQEHIENRKMLFMSFFLYFYGILI